MRPPGFSSGIARDRARRPVPWRARPARRACIRHLASGLRRQAPVPVHGASISTRSMRPARSSRSLPIVSASAPGRCARRPAPADRGSARGGACRYRWRRSALVVHHRRQRQRLAAGAGAKIDHLLAGLGAGEQGRELRALVLDFDHALDEGLFRMDRRALAPGGDADAQAPRRPARRLRREIGQGRAHRVALAFQRIDAQVERRARGQRRALLRPPGAEARFELRIEPLRIIARDMRRRAVEISVREPRALGVGQWLRREARAVAEFCDRLDVEAAFELEHAEQIGARRLARP